MYDILIIGGGVVGASIARELSRYDLAIAVVEKENDVAMGASKANSAIVHGGYAESYTTLRGRLCFEGRKQMKALDSELHFDFHEIGSLVIARDDEQMKEVERLYQNGINNGLTDLEVLSANEVKSIEPNITPDVVGALYCKGAGIISPYGLTIALMENAVSNGAELMLNRKVTAITQKADGFKVETEGKDGGKELCAKYVINAGGINAGEIAQMVGIDTVKIRPRSGQYILMRAGTGAKVNHVIFQTPSKMGKGILVTPTYHNNLMLGPDALDEESMNKDTCKERLYDIYKQSQLSVPSVDINEYLKSFAGVRAVPDSKDFIIEMSPVPNFIQAAGIQSPGLTSSPAIAKMVAEIIKDSGLELTEKADFNPNRDPIVNKGFEVPATEVEDRLKLESGDENRLVCRCEKVAETAMRDALSRNIPFDSIDGMKRRTRCSMGICQGFFCRPRTKELMEGILGKEIDIKKDIEVAGYHRVERKEMLDYCKQQEEN